MNVTSTVRRSDQPVQIGGRHGYRIDGDSAHINAELSVPPYHPGGAWALELWACEQAYDGGELSGVKVSEVQFDLPTPIAPHIHKVEAQAPARLPLQGLAHTMLLALVELGGAERRIHDVASYPVLETFPAPHFAGEVGYEIRGHELLLQAAAVANPRPEGNLSGTLSLELWASPLSSLEAPEAGTGHCLGAAQLAPVAGGESAFGLHCRAVFSEPPPGEFRLELLLREWTRALGYLTRDRRAFELHYQQASRAQDAEEEEELVWELPVAVAEPVAVLLEPAVVAAEPVAALPEPALAAEAVVLPEPAVVPEPALVAAQPALVLPEPAVVAAEPAALPAPALVAPPSVVVSASQPSVPSPVAPKSSPAAVPAAPVTRTGPRAISVQTASLEELSRVKGLNLKVAKEIVKARPFKSLDELVKVQGIGRKTLDKIRSFLTL
ncbi:MAG: helix-hairpin-helix domain-containing protein [Deltaproteobacteria bacterium]